MQQVFLNIFFAVFERLISRFMENVKGNDEMLFLILNLEDDQVSG